MRGGGRDGVRGARSGGGVRLPVRLSSHCAWSAPIAPERLPPPRSRSRHLLRPPTCASSTTHRRTPSLCRLACGEVSGWRTVHRFESVHATQCMQTSGEEGAGGRKGWDGAPFSTQKSIHCTRRARRPKNPAKDSMLFDLAQPPAAPYVAVEGGLQWEGCSCARTRR